MLAILAVALGCAWLLFTLGEPNSPQAIDSATVDDGASAALPSAPPVVGPVAGDDPAPAGERSLAAPRPERLGGRILDAAGNGIAGVEVNLRTLRRSDRGFFMRRDTTDAEGQFVLENVDPDGIYVLYTEPIAGYPGYRLEGFTLDSLPAPFEIELARLRLIDIEGSIVDAEYAPVANFTFTVDSLDADYPARILTSDASGYFRLESFPAGELKFFTAAPEYFRILGLHAEGERYDNLTVVIDRGPYRLAGRIVDAFGEPIASARITLNSAISGNDYQSVAFRTRYTDTAGDFEFADLGGISHSLGVYTTGYRPKLVEHEFQSFSDWLEIRVDQ